HGDALRRRCPPRADARFPRGGRARALLAAAHLRRLDRAGQPGPAPLHLRPALGGVPHRRVGGGAVRSLEVAGRRLRLCRRADRPGLSLYRADPARADRAGGVALPDDPALGGRGLRVAGGHPARAADRAPRRPADVSRHVALAAPVAVALALAAYPVVASGYEVRATLQIFMWIVLAGSWNLISGLTGYVSFGHVAFFGAGAYAGAILISKAGWPWLAAALVGGGAAVLLALVIGYPCLRLKGPYF